MIGGFARAEDGAGNVKGMILFMASAMMAGVAVDGSNAWRVERQLQAATDTAALAGAANAGDQAAGRAIALEVARRNLEPIGLDGAIIADDVVYGAFDPTSGSFDPDVDPDQVNAAFVSAERAARRGNAIGTHLLRFAGRTSLDIGAHSIAMIAEGAAGGTSYGCENALIMTEDVLSTGGGNTWRGPICLHGERGLHTGGNDHYDMEVRLSAADEATITVNYIAPSSSASREDIILERSLTPRVLPELASLQSDLTAELSGAHGLTYDAVAGRMPSFLDGATIVELTAHWVVLKEAGTLQPWEMTNPGVVAVNSNTVYLAPGSVTFEGNLDLTRFGVVAAQDIQIGGGASLNFTDTFFFAGGTINASGDVRWGDPSTYCDAGAYNSYLLARSRLSLGGASSIHGVLGAAPQFAPGGAMQSAGGIYFEASQRVDLGGAYDVTGCGAVLESELEIERVAEGAVSATGSVLVR